MDSCIRFGQSTKTFVMRGEADFREILRAVTRNGFRLTSVPAMALLRHRQNLSGTQYNDLVNRADLSQPFSIQQSFRGAESGAGARTVEQRIREQLHHQGLAGSSTPPYWKKTNVILGGRDDWVDITRAFPAMCSRRRPRCQEKERVSPGPRGFVRNREGRPAVRHVLQAGDAGPRYRRRHRRRRRADALNGSELREVGIKTQLVRQPALRRGSGYRQTRLSFSQDTGQVLSTLSRGGNSKCAGSPTKRLSLHRRRHLAEDRLLAVRASTIQRRIPPSSVCRITTTAAASRPRCSAQPDYAERSGYPDKVLTSTAPTSSQGGWSVNLSGRYQAVGVLRTHQGHHAAGCPRGRSRSSSTTRQAMGLRFTVNNLTNELYFTPNSPDGLGEVIVIPAPERNYQTSFTFKF